MKRRSAVKAMALSALGSTVSVPVQAFTGLISKSASNSPSYKSNWENWPDMKWVGPEYWGNRLQDWELQDGQASCVISGQNRTLHILTPQLGAQEKDFQESVRISWLNKDLLGNSEAYIGFRLGAKGRFDEYRSSAVFGEGLDIGINGQGKLFAPNLQSEDSLDLTKAILLICKVEFKNGVCTLVLTASQDSGKRLELRIASVEPKALQGNISLVAHTPKDFENQQQAMASFQDWAFEGEKLEFRSQQFFGPVSFAQYTLHRGTLKLTAQLSPVEKIPGVEAIFEIQNGNSWDPIGRSGIEPMARTASFRVENWVNERKNYRVSISLPLKTGMQDYFYYGTIAQEPGAMDSLKTAVFSCNADYGFPDEEVSIHVAKHQPDLALFLGDQFYESTGGFGIQTGPFGKSSLDYLRKWYMFGWSYREIFRHIPVVFMPDDHDVYHGNVWGEEGKAAPTDKGWGAVAQDAGGFKMEASWVNMVQVTQCSHLPDPFDSKPVKQGIQVYFTELEYGGVSFAILEDRKFKSAPKRVLPEEAQVQNGFIRNPDFDIKEYYDIDAQLLGDRQMNFLNYWVHHWGPKVQMKTVLSQTNFCTVATLPKGSLGDDVVPSLSVPQKGEYVSGDAPTVDMDSNGWPQKGRDEAVRLIRKSHALHIAGDQHLASTVQYGVEEFRDSGFAFAGPALNNLWPRRFWPTLEAGHQSIPGKGKYTGDFEDGFGNKMSVFAVANPYQTGREPARIYDRATGYGIVTFDKKKLSARIECWPRFVDPEKEPKGQYADWPLEVKMEDNYGRKALGFLQPLEILGAENPLITVVDEQNQDLVYVRRINEAVFSAKVFKDSSYQVTIENTSSGIKEVLNGLKISQSREPKRINLK